MHRDRNSTASGGRRACKGARCAVPDVLSARVVAMAVAPGSARVAPGYRCPPPRSRPLRRAFTQADTSPALDFWGVFSPSPPKTSPALPRHPHLPGEGGEILPFPQRVELFPLQQPAVFTANIAQGFGSLASPECKTFSHRNIFFMQGKRSLSNKKHFS